jgi:dTDP-4-amino-4,6-dideoxygalactose transaminase
MLPMVDLKAQYQALKAEIDAALAQVLGSTRFILGPNVKAFEEEAAAYLGVKHTIGVASGTDALHLALVAAGIGEGDEVITTPFTFVATAEAIRYVGACPVFVDIDRRTFNIDVTQVEAAITPATRAILPVHLFGQAADMPALAAVADKHGLVLIEDCAQSFGGECAGRKTGDWGLAGCFSFFPSKNLGCYGDGGLIATSSDEMAAHLQVLRNHGSWQPYHHSELGFNSRLDELQAAILRIKLKYIDKYNANRWRIAQHYSKALAELPDCLPPYEDKRGSHVYHQYTLLTPRRDEIKVALAAQDIASAIYYPIPLHKQTLFQASYHGVSLPVCERLATQCLSLPIFPEMREQQAERVIAVIRGVLLGP